MSDRVTIDGLLQLARDWRAGVAYCADGCTTAEALARAVIDLLGTRSGVFADERAFNWRGTARVEVILGNEGHVFDAGRLRERCVTWMRLCDEAEAIAADAKRGGEAG